MAEIADIDATKVIDVPKEDVMRRAISWKGAFWVASGAPAFVLFSIGGLAATIVFGMTASSGTGANHVHILFD